MNHLIGEGKTFKNVCCLIFNRGIFDPIFNNVNIRWTSAVLHGVGTWAVLPKWLHFLVASHLPRFKR